MPNTFHFADWLAMEALILLESKRSVSQYFNTEYSKEFKQKFPIGDSLRVPFPQQFLVRNGLEYQPQEIKRRAATVTWDDPFGIDFEWDSAEAYLRAPRGAAKMKKEILGPAMSQLAQEFDSRCAQYAYQNAAGLVGVLGTDPTSFDAASAAARQKMQELGCPDDDRGMIIPPSVMRTLKNAAITYFNPVSDISKQFRTGIIGSGDGYEWYESMSLYRHTAGTWAGSVTVTSTQTGVEGISSFAVTCTNGDTFKKGDKFAVAAVLPVHPQTRRSFSAATKTFSITADAVGASSSATLQFTPPMFGPGSQYQNVSALPVASAALTLWPGTASPNGKVGNVGLALQNNAFAMVSAELEMPKESTVELASQQTDPDSGVTISFIRAFDVKQRKMVNRFDAWIGFGNFYNDACAIAVACG